MAITLTEAERRIQLLTTKINTLEGRIDLLSQKIDRTCSSETHRQTKDVLEEDISDLQVRATTTETSISTLQDILAEE